MVVMSSGFSVSCTMAPVSIPHDKLSRFVSNFFDVYLELAGGGEVLEDPVVMKTSPDLPGRQPDIQVLLPERMPLLEEYQMAGAANLVVEIVSTGSEDTDRGAKFREYEQGGVEEYWILDRKRRDAMFYVLGEDGLYHSRLSVDGVYTSVVLPKLRLRVEILWQETLPAIPEVVKMVEEMLKE
ncbi:MAG: Uma2 family endonuclease [Anaerolineae bacterium]